LPSPTRAKPSSSSATSRLPPAELSPRNGCNSPFAAPAENEDCRVPPSGTGFVRQGSALRTTCRARVERRRTTRQRSPCKSASVSGPTHLQLKFKPGSAISCEKPQPNEIAERRQARY
jgi:hypothetical protein